MGREYSFGLIKKKYEGDWKNGVQEGIGKTNHPDGREYLGEYKNGEENGFGEWSDLDGQTYRGEFKDGEFDGKGILNSLMVGVIRENSLKEELRVKGSINFQTEISQKGYGRTTNLGM